MAIKEFVMPDLGEGLTESELVSWSVAAGDIVELNQVIAEVETAKAMVELPSPYAGKVVKLFVDDGATVPVGAPILAFEVEDDSDGVSVPQGDSAPELAGVQPLERNPVLVGYGPPVETSDAPRRRLRRASLGLDAQTKREVLFETTESLNGASTAPAQPAERPKATPPVRKLATDLGIDLTRLIGTGDGGVITRKDVLSFSASEPPMTTTSNRERETRVPIKGVRKHTAAAMVSSAFTAPHATEFLTIDVTPTMELLESIKGNRAFAGHRITILTVVAKAITIAIARNPSLNTRWDDAAGEIVQFRYVNLGIAAATDRGLIVPNIKDVDQLDLIGLADAISDLTEAARAGTTSSAQLSGGTITITNIGVFGIDAGTPILNPGEAAILAMGAISRRPWEHQGEVALRNVMTLSLSFDHRLVDGEQGSRFLADIGAILANPGMSLAMV